MGGKANFVATERYRNEFFARAHRFYSQAQPITGVMAKIGMELNPNLLLGSFGGFFSEVIRTVPKEPWSEQG